MLMETTNCQIVTTISPYQTIAGISPELDPKSLELDPKNFAMRAPAGFKRT